MEAEYFCVQSLPPISTCVEGRGDAEGERGGGRGREGSDVTGRGGTHHKVVVGTVTWPGGVVGRVRGGAKYAATQQKRGQTGRRDV